MELFSKKEVIDFALSCLTISIIFSLPNFGRLIYNFFAASIVLFPKIIGEKLIAGKMEGKSIFRFNLKGFLLGFFLSFFRIRLVPTFYTEVYGYKFGRWNRKNMWLSVKEIGMISAFSLFFVLILSALLYYLGIKDLALMGIWIVFSSTLPFKNMDGEKILNWEWGIWAFLFILSLLTLIIWI